MSVAPPRVLARSAALAQGTPAWKPWLERLDRAAKEDASRRFDALRVSAHRYRDQNGGSDHGLTTDGASAVLVAVPNGGVPVLEGAEIVLPSRTTLAWLQASFGRRLARTHGLALLRAAIAGERNTIEAVAVVTREDGAALSADAFAAAIPVLQALRRHLAAETPSPSGEGRCPLCGAWPAIAESRGLERARRLRCGGCGSDWSVPWLRCVHCRESDHRRQTALVPEAGGEARRVETCESCRGYVKTIATISALDPEVVPFEDLATVDLDVVALDRGYAVPPRVPIACRVRLEEAP